jgi:hypothetical protein
MKITKTDSNRNLAGEYKETLVDEIKKVSNRLVSICGKYYTVITEDMKTLEFTSKRSFDKWAKTNSYVTDF